jgi:hypothetical protein
MSDDSEGGVSQEIRNALLENADLTIGEIYERCTLAASTSAVASMMHTECVTGRATRIGERGSYRYRLTELGVAIARNPNLLKSRHARRRPGGPKPKIPENVVRNLATAPKSHERTPDRDLPLPSMGAASTARRSEQSALSFDDSNLRLAFAVMAHWPRGHSIPIPVSELVFETIDQARGI